MLWLCFSWLWSGSISHSVVDKKLSAFAQRLPRLSCGSFRTPHRGASTYLVQAEPFDKACGPVRLLQNHNNPCTLHRTALIHYKMHFTLG